MTSSIDHNHVLRTTDRYGDVMPAVTVSPKFQVVIPKEIREQMRIEPGQKVQMMIYKGHVVMVPIRPMEELRGSLKGVTEPFEREEDRM